MYSESTLVGPGRSKDAGIVAVPANSAMQGANGQVALLSLTE